MTKLFRLFATPIASVAAMLISFLSVTAPAREATAPVAEGASLARPALWRISDHDTTVYLFGTIHALPPGVHWFAGPIAAAFQESDELVTEIAGSEAADVQALTVRLALLPPGQSLRDGLSHGERMAFEAALAHHGLPSQAYDRFKPWFAAIALSNLPLIKLGFTPASGAEALLAAQAKAANRPHTGLETAEYQLGLFDGLPPTTQRTYLSEVVKHTPTIAEELLAVVEEWKGGNPDKLAELMNADQDDPHMVAVLLTNRNHAWAQWIEQRMEAPGTVFMAVGAGHMAGTGGLLDQLDRLGFTATRLQ
jgi:uncharacterized protein YbaP (TraB family)